MGGSMSPIRVVKISELRRPTRNKESVVEHLEEFHAAKLKLHSGLKPQEAIEISIPKSTERGRKHLARSVKDERLYKTLRKRLDRTEAYLTEDRRSWLQEILTSDVTTTHQKARAEKLLKKLDQRSAAKAERHKHLEELLEAFDKKPTVPTDSTPHERQESVPVETSPEVLAAAEQANREAKAARIAELEPQVKRIKDSWKRPTVLGQMTPQEAAYEIERESAILNEYDALTAQPKPEPEPLTAEEKRRKLIEAERERRIEEMRQENIRVASEPYPSHLIPDISIRIPPPRQYYDGGADCFMPDGSVRLYGGERVPKGWEDRYRI
jgi:hypothetical protein